MKASTETRVVAPHVGTWVRAHTGVLTPPPPPVFLGTYVGQEHLALCHVKKHRGSHHGISLPSQ